MKLITEEIYDYKVITEDLEEGKGRRYYIEGVYLQSNIKNRNGRIYPESVMDREVDRYTKSLVNEGRAVGELGHPQGPTINLDRVSHKIVSLRKENTNYIGKAMITSTPMGDIAKGLLEDGVKLGVSSRGMGTLKPNNGIMEVQDDFYLSTAADIVADPSAPDAFVKGIMEGVDWVWDNGLFRQVELEEAKEEIDNSVSKGELEEAVLHAWNKLLKF